MTAAADPRPWLQGPASQRSVLWGIDVASYQDGIDLTAMPSVDFVIVKASEGRGYRNPQLAVQVASAQAAGKAWGLYHFVSAGNTVEQEVANYLAAVAQYRDFVPVLDYEPADRSRTDFAAAWLDQVEAALGVRPWLYCDSSTASREWAGVKGRTPLWLARYPLRPSTTLGTLPDDGWSAPGWDVVAWQYTADGYVGGWGGRLDLDVFYGDHAKWASHCARRSLDSGPVISDPTPPPVHTPWPEPEPPTHWLPDLAGTVPVTLSSGPLYRSGTTTPRRAHPVVAEWLWWYERLLMAKGLVKVNLDVYQLQGDSSLSGGTHRCPTAADVLDTGPEGIRVAREMGGKGWRRIASRGWTDGDHDHIVIPVAGYNDCNRYQIDAFDAGYNGLGATGRAATDPDPRPTVTRTPAQGIEWAKAEIARIKGTATPTPAPKPPQEDDMIHISSPGRDPVLVGPGFIRRLNSPEEVEQAKALAAKVLVGNDRQYDLWLSMVAPAAPTAPTPPPPLDPAMVRAAIAEALSGLRIVGGAV